jgi:hypothetical protein
LSSLPLHLDKPGNHIQQWLGDQSHRGCEFTEQCQFVITSQRDQVARSFAYQWQNSTTGRLPASGTSSIEE